MSRNGGLGSLGTSDRPPNFFRKVLRAGIVSVVVAFILETPFGYILKPYESFYGTVLLAAVVAPLVEETTKALSAIYIVKRIHPDAGFFVGLTFGAIETLLYVLSYAQTLAQATLLTVVRFAVSVPLHAACTAMFLYGLYVRQKPKYPDRYMRIISAYLVHALFNFSAVAG